MSKSTIQKMLRSLVFLYIILQTPFLVGQAEEYIRINQPELTCDYILLYPNGRFAFIHDEICYSSFEASGKFTEREDTIDLSFFVKLPSRIDLKSISPRGDSLVSLRIKTFHQTDSSAIPNIQVFARDSTRALFDYKGRTDSIGEVIITVPKGRTIKYLNLQSYQFVFTEYKFKERYGVNYELEAYLSEYPYAHGFYDGPTVLDFGQKPDLSS